jgi:photosystem II stability/assembly factor-like uncharacterized protein
MEGYACGAQGTLVRTSDGGRSWERLDTGVLRDLYSVRFFADGTWGIIAGDERTILFTANSGNSWVPAQVNW